MKVKASRLRKVDHQYNSEKNPPNLNVLTSAARRQTSKLQIRKYNIKQNVLSPEVQTRKLYYENYTRPTPSLVSIESTKRS